MTQTIDTPRTGAFRASPDIMVFPGDRAWDATRQARSATSVHGPAAVALPRTPADLVAAVEYAHELGLGIAVQAAAEDAPSRPLDGTILIDLTHLNGA